MPQPSVVAPTYIDVQSTRIPNRVTYQKLGDAMIQFYIIEND